MRGKAKSPPGTLRMEWLTTLPSLGWLLLFVVAPFLIILALSFRPPDATGAIGSGWTLQNWTAWLRPDVHHLAINTAWLSAVTTVMCLALSIPMAWFMVRTKPQLRRLIQLLVIIPFWTNFLIRIFAWKVLLNHEGLITRVARAMGLTEPQDSLLYNNGAVLLVLIYTHLPFSILPIYSAAEKFDFTLLDAAQDLGASTMRGIFSVFLPGISTGIAAGGLMVFVPALGSYLIPEMMGGHLSEMLGSRISQRAFSDRNLPEASALASGLTLSVLIAVAAIWKVQKWWTIYRRSRV